MATKKKTTKAAKAKVVDESPKREAPDVQPAADETESVVPALEDAAAAPADSEVPKNAESDAGEGKEGEAEAGVVEETASDPEAPVPDEKAEAEASVENEKPEVEPEPEAEVVPEPEPEPEVDPEGVITALTPKIYDTLLKKWQSAGNPRTFSALGGSWSVYTEGDGYKFVATRAETGLGLYNDLSTG